MYSLALIVGMAEMYYLGSFLKSLNRYYFSSLHSKDVKSFGKERWCDISIQQLFTFLQTQRKTSDLEVIFLIYGMQM